MARDPYTVLGVSKSASESEIKSAYRRLAKRYHPDTNSNDPKAQERFSEANAAYEIVGDKDKRAKFDRGEIDAAGQPRFHAGFGSGGAGASRSADSGVLRLRPRRGAERGWPRPRPHMALHLR